MNHLTATEANLLDGRPVDTDSSETLGVYQNEPPVLHFDALVPPAADGPGNPHTASLTPPDHPPPPPSSDAPENGNHHLKKARAAGVPA